MLPRHSLAGQVVTLLLLQQVVLPNLVTWLLWGTLCNINGSSQLIHVSVKELWAVPACKPVHDKLQQQSYLIVLKTLVPCGWLHMVGSSICLVWAHSSPQRTSGGTVCCTRRKPASAPGWRQNGTPPGCFSVHGVALCGANNIQTKSVM